MAKTAAKDEKKVTEPLVEDTPAAETIKAHPSVSRSDVMASLMTAVAKVPSEDLTSWWFDALKSMENLGRNIPDGTAERNKDSITAKPSFANPGQPPIPAIQAVKEDLQELLNDQEDLPKEFVEKALVLFESAINARVALETAKIEDEADEAREQDVEALVDKIDGYLEYAAEEFFTKNQLAVESSLRLAKYEQFINALHELFTEHYIEVPEERTDVLEALEDRVTELETELNDRTDEILALRDALDAERAKKVFDESCKGLSAQDVEKFKKLAETIEFSGDEEDLANKLSIIRESHFKEANKKKPEGRKLDMVTEGEVIEVQPIKKDGDEAEILAEVDVDMQPFVAALNRTTRNR